MKGIYKRFKEDFQKGIRAIAEMKGISPLEILTAVDGELFTECAALRKRIEMEIVEDFCDIPKEDIETLYYEFVDEVDQFICPGFINVPTESNLITADINRRLLDEGYEPVNPEILGLIVDEYLLPNLKEAKG